MAKVDFERYDFDFDLTFALVLMEPDGTILHTFGGRDYTDAESHLSMAALVATLRKTLVQHRAHTPTKPPAAGKTVEVLSAYEARVRRDKGKHPKCIHCHDVHDMLRESAVRDGSWKREDAWRWPDPRQVGLTMDRDVQQRVTDVARGSPADRAGVRPGDLLTRVGTQHVLTFGDLQRALHRASPRKGRLPITWTRDGKVHEHELALPRDWKTPTPLVFSWRSTKWHMPPQPGFGGPPLDDAAKEKLGLAREPFAFRINYLVTWGPRAATGRAARKAGLRKGDVVTAVDGKQDFRDMHHFHAWVRLTRKPGATMEVRYLRGNEARTARIELLK